jgi:hypothetical protein
MLAVCQRVGRTARGPRTLSDIAAMSAGTRLSIQSYAVMLGRTSNHSRTRTSSSRIRSPVQDLWHTLVAKCPPRANCSAASRRPTTSSSTAAAANDSVTPQSANSTSTSKAWNCPPTPTYGSISTPPTQALTPPTGSPAQHLGSHYPPGHRRPTHALNRRTAPAAPANSAIPGSVMARQAQSEQDTNRVDVGQRRGEADSAASARLAGGR